VVEVVVEVAAAVEMVAVAVMTTMMTIDDRELTAMKSF
jgi:hypothetical protein